jgi:hypothetical protein
MNRTYSRVESRALPSAILEGIETEQRRI